MPHVLATGGAGFFGGLLKRHLLRHRRHVTSIDRAPDTYRHPHLTRLNGDLRDPYTAKARERLGWHPSLTCEQTLVQIYRDSTSRREQTGQRGQFFDWSGSAPVGVIRLLKWVS